MSQEWDRLSADEKQEILWDDLGRTQSMLDNQNVRLAQAEAQLIAVKTWALDPLATQEDLLKLLDQEPAKSLPINPTKTPGW